MVELKVLNVNEYNNFLLKDVQTEKVYSLFLEFYNVPNIEVGDTIFLNHNLLNPQFEGFAQPYAFELFSGEVDVKNNNEDLEFCSKNKKYCLKRIYG